MYGALYVIPHNINDGHARMAAMKCGVVTLVEGHTSPFITSLFGLLFDKRLSSPGITKVCDFQLNLAEPILESFYFLIEFLLQILTLFHLSIASSNTKVFGHYCLMPFLLENYNMYRLET